MSANFVVDACCVQCGCLCCQLSNLLCIQAGMLPLAHEDREKASTLPRSTAANAIVSAHHWQVRHIGQQWACRDAGSSKSGVIRGSSLAGPLLLLLIAGLRGRGVRSLLLLRSRYLVLIVAVRASGPEPGSLWQRTAHIKRRHTCLATPAKLTSSTNSI